MLMRGKLARVGWNELLGGVLFARATCFSLTLHISRTTD
jgi:hypothetical protein